jgi:hypothetical protein
MKKVILASILALMISTSFAAETKKVCHDETRNGKQVQVCKTIKVHKKLEGTNVEDTKPKK